LCIETPHRPELFLGVQLKLLLTGASGFVGTNMQQLLPCIPLNDSEGRIDLRDSGRMKRAVTEIQPDAVVHLGATTFVPESFQSARETYEINFLGTLNLLEVLAKCGFSGRIIFAGTGDAYGRVEAEDLPLNETHVLRPRSPYAVSKAAAEALCYQWSQTGSFEVVLARPFNHIGPGQSSRFVVSDFARQIIEIKLGRRDAVIQVGDIAITRDFTDVRDVVRAYRLLLERGQNGQVYNICSGAEISISTVLATLLELAGVKAEISELKDRKRINEQKRAFGSYRKLHYDCGWMPSIGLEQSLRDILGHWQRVLG
jgi:GDP-4-dehydro-6-deoxy-D-mannose reductase